MAYTVRSKSRFDISSADACVDTYGLTSSKGAIHVSVKKNDGYVVALVCVMGFHIENTN